MPNQETLGVDFITWLKKQFGWLFTQAAANTSIGTAYVYGDREGEIPEWAVLGEYDNGSAKGKGRTEYIWLPLEDGTAIPVGLYRNGKLFAVHTDHLGTPRVMKNEANEVVWQWPYSAFGHNKPSGVLKETDKPRQALTAEPLVKATNPQQDLELRFPGQYFDAETGLAYNLHGSYLAGQGRYTQFDPIGLAGGWNGYTYADNTPLTIIDPLGLMGQGSGASGRTPTWGKGGPNTVARPLTFSAFGCMGLMCASGGMHNDGPQFSAELTFGGGFEICEPPPPPPPEPESCRRNDGSGFYSGPGKAQVQPPGVPVPKRFGGAFFGPSWKANGQFCLRVGPHGSVPFVPSIDLPPPWS